MTIPLVDGWDPSKVAAKVYSTTGKDREEIDKAFDKLHQQGQMEFSNKPTPFAYPVFVVWRTISKEDGSTIRKARVVVDICGLNKITMPDSYPLPRQLDIIAAVKGCPYISTMDRVAFFYQWLVARQDHHKLTVITHQGLEHFNVAVMGFRDLPPYVQRQIDRILRAHGHYAHAYIDDIVVFSKTQEEHLAHLDNSFRLLTSLDIVLAPTKTFLGFPSTTLLGQKVDSFGMAAASEKIQAISRLAFPITLQDLEHYLGLTGWMCDYVPYYAQIVEPLQLRKTEMLRGLAKSGTSGKQRKRAAHSTRLVEPTDKERASFNCLQGILSKGGFLHYFDSSRRLYIDLDSLKRGVGVIVYHVKGDPDPEKATDICKTNIQPIMFLSKLLSTAESHYWPTEVEMAGLVWAIKKLCHFIDSTAKLVIVYTDQSAITSIARQTTLSSSNTNKLNNCLIRASQYLVQFNIDVQYKPGKHHLVPDALLRLPVEGSNTDQTLNILDGLTEVEALLVTAIELISTPKLVSRPPIIPTPTPSPLQPPSPSPPPSILSAPSPFRELLITMSFTAINVPPVLDFAAAAAGNGGDPPPTKKPISLRAQYNEEGSGSESVGDFVVVDTSGKRRGNGVGAPPRRRSKRAQRLPTEDASDSGDACPEWCHDDESLPARAQQARCCGSRPLRQPSPPRPLPATTGTLCVPCSRSSTPEELVAAMAVLPESTAHVLWILNAHQSCRRHENIKFNEWRRIEEMGSEALSDSKDRSGTAGEE
ncbi:MAG: reverse transcriptase [Lasallia pustulata]|uniref:Reverse transcriptase n=1 Tax=Lasallia pustulata TaxID=136370 RepID=A0A5M8PNP6_9LECA|nr:MAG: reverse transcriptase [Lasallia pustulata]